MFTSIGIFTGNANPVLAKAITDYLGVPLGAARVTRFSGGEVWVEIKENVCGVDVYVIQPTCSPVNDNMMELLVMVDALKRASAATITAVVPYYGYARQDKKVQPRTPITAKVVADLLSTVGVSRVVAVDLHAGQIQGFFNIPFDHIFAMPVMLEYMRPKFDEQLVFVSFDVGGVECICVFAKCMSAELTIIDKRREAPNVSETMHIVGDVQDRVCMILDDMIDTAGTLCNAARSLKEHGAKRVFAAATHAVLSGPAIERIGAAPLEEVVVTDTIPLREDAIKSGKFKVLTVAPLLGETIKRIHDSDSVSSLFV